MDLRNSQRSPSSVRGDREGRQYPETIEGNIGAVLGTATGEEEHSTVGGGWTGADDATSTAPSDLMGIPAPRPEQEGEISRAIHEAEDRLDLRDEVRASLLPETEEEPAKPPTDSRPE